MAIGFLILALALADEAELIRHEVICAESGFCRAAEARDMVEFLSFVDPDARFISSRVARGRAEIGDAWSAVLTEGGPTMRWRPAFVEVVAEGNIAISRGPYRSTRIDENGEAHHSWGHFISTWRRNEDGRWQVLFDTGGDAGMQPTEWDVEVLESEPQCP